MTKKSSRKIKSVVASLLANRKNNKSKNNKSKNKKEMAQAIDDYLKCGDSHCDKIIKRLDIGKLQSKYLQRALKECKPIKKKSEKKKCWSKVHKNSEFSKKMAERKKCVKKNCSKKQKTLNKNLKIMKFEF